MSDKDFSRTVTLLCPVCASSAFSYDDGLTEDERLYTCEDCGSSHNFEDLKSQNGERIENEISEIKSEVVRDMQKSISKMFKKLR